MNMDNSILLQEINASLKEQNRLLQILVDQTKPTKVTVIEASPGDLQAPDKIADVTRPIGNATSSVTTSKATTTTKTVIKK